MKVGAVIAEYNPFHKGHLYQLKQTLAYGADFTVAVMSGNFVQRCESALLCKHSRAEMALLCGIDLVLELPLPWAIASAEKFARGAVEIVNALGLADFLSFGSECADTQQLERTARLVMELDGGEEIKKSLASGVSFPKAREEAIKKLAKNGEGDVLNSPNDILGIEYIKALIQTNSPVKPLAVKRVGAGHDSGDELDGYASASEIRRRIRQYGSTDSADMLLPPQSLEIIRSEIKKGTAPSNYLKLETAILSDLRKRDREYFLKLPDVSEGLENRIFNAACRASSLKELFENIKTKRYTFSRVRRVILSAYLEVFAAHTKEPPPYIRVLGMNSRGAELLGEIKKKSSLPIVARTRDIENAGGRALEIFKQEARSTALYNLTLPAIRAANTEYTDKLVIID